MKGGSSPTFVRCIFLPPHPAPLPQTAHSWRAKRLGERGLSTCRCVLVVQKNSRIHGRVLKPCDWCHRRIYLPTTRVLSGAKMAEFEMFDFINRCLYLNDDYLTGTLIVHTLDSRSGRALPLIRVMIGSNLDEAIGKT